MGTEVLRPQDCLIERIRRPPVSIYRQSYGNCCNHNKNYVPSSRSSRKPAKRPESSGKRRRVVVPSQPIPVTSVSRRSSSDDLRMARSSGMMREKVTILRRGESLDSKIMCEALTKNGGDDFVTCPVQAIYAGSAFVVSPLPSALPLPSFSKKQPSAVVADSATRDLRRLLKLE